MRKVGLFLISVLLLVPASGVRAQEKPPEPPGTGTEPAPAPDQSPYLIPMDVHITVDGRSVDAAPPGESVRVAVELLNNGYETATDVRAHISAFGGATVSDADATYPDIAPNATRAGAFTVTTQKTPCEDFAGFLIDITFAGGSSQMKFGVPVACPGPRLAVERVDFGGGDGDDVPEPGETVRAFVYLRNNGRDPAKDVTAKVTVTGKGVPSTSDDLAWPDIAAGGLERSKTAIEFSIPKDAPRQEGCSGTPVVAIPPEEGGTATDLPANDTPVSSDGSTVSSDGGNVSSDGGSSAGSPGSAGSGEPTVVEPDPGTGTPEPAPEPGTVEPAPGGPIPVPEPRTPEPQPKSTDQPAYIELHLAARADGYSEGVDYSNGLFCAVAEGGAASKAPDAAPQAARDTAFLGKTLPLRTQHNAGVDIGIAALVAIAAVGVRRYVLR